MQATDEAPIGATEAAEMLEVSKDTLLRKIARGEITSAHKMPGISGAWLFARAEIKRLKAEADEQAAKAAAS